MHASVADGGAVVAGVGGAEPVAGGGVDADGIGQADVAATSSGVAARVQGSFQRGGEVVFHEDAIRKPLVMEARRVDGGLRVHAKAHPVDDAKQSSGNDGWAAG